MRRRATTSSGSGQERSVGLPFVLPAAGGRFPGEARARRLRMSDPNETHRRLIDYVHSVPEEQFTRETRFRASPTA
jgi:hypothetical protein